MFRIDFTGQPAWQLLPIDEPDELRDAIAVFPEKE